MADTHDHYLNLDSFMALVESPRPAGSGSSSTSTQGSRGKKDWTFGMGYKGAVDALASGWESGTRDMIEGLGALKDTLGTSERAEWFTAPVGSFVNVPAYLAGAPNNMWRRRKVRRASPIVRLVLPVVASACTPASAILNRGIALLALCDSLEDQGFRAEIIASWFTEYQGEKTAITIMVKEAGDPLRLGQLAFPLAHPAFMRRLVFAACERSSSASCRRSTQSGYGYIQKHNSKEFRDLTGWADAITIPEFHYRNENWSTRQWYDSMHAVVAKEFTL